MGLAIVWKPLGAGSQDYLGQFKRSMGLAGSARKDIGHSGTLDPFAEGLLLVGWNEGTKLLAPLTGLPKTYLATVFFGATSDTLDHTGEVTATTPASTDCVQQFFNAAALGRFLSAKIGEQSQVPPQYSAIKINGQRAYDLARKGKQVEIAARPFTVLYASHQTIVPASLNNIRGWAWTFEITVTSGTYIRALARDWALEISGAPGLLTNLVRTAIGPYALKRNAAMSPVPDMQALDLADLEKLFSVKQLNGSDGEKLRANGQWFPERHALASDSKYLLLDQNEKIIAWCDGATGKLGRVFQTDPLG